MATLAEVGLEELMSILASETLTLVPSESNTPVRIHKHLLDSLSPSLHAASQGGWEESTSGVYKFLKGDGVSCDSITKELLVCFARWAYIGDYSTEIVGISSYVDEHVVPENAVAWADGFRGKQCERCRERVFGIEDDPPSGWAGFGTIGERDTCRNCRRCKKCEKHVLSRSPPPPEPSPPSDTSERAYEEEDQDASSANEPHAGGSGTEAVSCSHPLLLHIQLYVFATIYLIDPLKVISKRKIVAYLEKVENSCSREKSASAVFDLLDCAFSYLPDDDPLLDWLARYASWKLAELRRDPRRLEGLLTKGSGKFTWLVIRHVIPSQKDPFTSPS